MTVETTPTINRRTSVIYSVLRSGLLIGGVLLLIQVCTNTNGLEFLNYLFGCIFLFAWSGWSIIIFQLSKVNNRVLQVIAGTLALITGPALQLIGFLDFSLYIPLSDQTAQRVLGGLLGFAVDVGFVLLGLSIISDTFTATRNSNPAS